MANKIFAEKKRHEWGHGKDWKYGRLVLMTFLKAAYSCEMDYDSLIQSAIHNDTYRAVAIEAAIINHGRNEACCLGHQKKTCHSKHPLRSIMARIEIIDVEKEIQPFGLACAATRRGRTRNPLSGSNKTITRAYLKICSCDCFVWFFCWNHWAISRLIAQWFQQSQTTRLLKNWWRPMTDTNQVTMYVWHPKCSICGSASGISTCKMWMATSWSTYAWELDVS